MQIVTTCEDLRIACGTNTVAQTGFRRKKTGELHEGHIMCIEACKKEAQLTLVTFFPHEQLINWIYGSIYPLPTGWDEDYCTKFCETNGVDIVFIPSDAEIKDTFFPLLQPQDIKSASDTIITSKQYSGYSGTFPDYIIAMETARKQKNLYPKDVCVFSIKDGYGAFMRKNYYENDLLIPCVLVDMAYRPDGLPVASSFNSVSKETLDILALMYNTLKSKTYEEFDKMTDFTELTDELNAHDPNKIVVVDFIRMWKQGIIGNNKLLVELATHENILPLEKLVVLKENVNAIKEIL